MCFPPCGVDFLFSRAGYDLGDFLCDRALSSTVIFQLQFVDHRLCVLAGRVHSHAARRDLAREALAHRGYQPTRDVQWDGGIQNGALIRFEYRADRM